MNNPSDIREHMEVYGSCGKRVGTVDHIEGNSIKLTKNSSPDGQHHYLPMVWVESVGQDVRLNKDCGAAQREWQDAPLAPSGV